MTGRTATPGQPGRLSRAGQKNRARQASRAERAPAEFSASGEVSALLAIAQRDVVKLLRDKLRLAVNLAFPVLLIAGLGSLLQATVGKVTGLSTITLSFTGVLAASLFQSAAAGMISIVEDRENDFSRELFIAPVSRLT